MSGRPLLIAAIIVTLFWGAAGCDKSKSTETAKADTPGTKNAPDPKALPAPEREAREAAMAAIAKHWTKGPDGWTTLLNQGTDFAPIEYLRQVRDFTIDHVDANDLNEADRLNGFEWAGQVWLTKAPTREAGEQGVAFDGLADITVMRRRGQWSQWTQYQPPPLQVQKVKGKWDVHHDNSLVSGKVPTPADYTKAGVK